MESRDIPCLHDFPKLRSVRVELLNNPKSSTIIDHHRPVILSMKPSSTTIETIFNIILPNLLSGAKSQKTLPFPLLLHLASIVPLQPLPKTTCGRFPVPATYLFGGGWETSQNICVCFSGEIYLLHPITI